MNTNTYLMYSLHSTKLDEIKIHFTRLSRKIMNLYQC